MFVIALSTLLTVQSDQALFDRVRTAAFEESRVMSYAAHLCDRIGPRLTGSPELEAATTWAVEQLGELELRTAREAWQIPTGWARGPASARLVAPVRRDLWIASCAWSRPTAGTLRGTLAPGAAESEWMLRGDGGDVARLVDSARPYRLFDMRAADPLSPFEPPAIPVATITAADAALLTRLGAAGPLELELTLDNRLTGEPVTVHDVTGEIEGGRRSDEIVFAAAHLDSWDLASGATDDAAGCAVLLEAARILASMPRRPLRTVRFLLFAGGAQGHQGSARYVARHRDEVPRIAAGLALDGGTGAVLGVALEGQRHLLELVEKWFLVVKEDLAVHDVSFRDDGPSDHSAFLRAGVPAFKLIQQPVDYRLTRGSQADTFDALVELNLQQAAATLAWGLWAIADHDGDIPRARD